MKSMMVAAAFVASAVLCLPACSPASAPESGAVALPLDTRCAGEVSRDWSAVGSQYYMIEAELSGGACEDADATLRIRSPEGAVLFEQAYPLARLQPAFNVYDPASLTSDLEAWSANGAEIQTVDWLPPWPAGAPSPPNFEPAVSRSAYEAARGAQGPLFCFADAADSLSCVALAGERAILLGSLKTAAG
jgi:hypothetical protein